MKKQTKDVFVVDTLEQLKVLSDGLRMRIVEAFSREPKTTKQVAQFLGEKQLTKLYHHVEALERAGILILVRTKKNRGTVEKYYQTVAKTFRVDQALFAPQLQGEAATAALRDIYTSIFDTTIAEMQRSIADKLIQKQNDHKAIVTRLHLRGSAKQIEQLKQKLQKLLEEIEELQNPEGELKYALTLAFYPIAIEDQKGE